MLKSGDILVVKHPILTLADKVYNVGDELQLIEPTGMAPFGFKSNLCNWVVKCPYFSPPDDRSVWGGIWMLVERGWLEVKDDESTA